MPRVPTYEQFSVAQAPLPGVRQSTGVNAEMLGEAEAREMQQAGAGILRAGAVFQAELAREQAEFDEAAVKELDTSLANRHREILTGYRGQLGRNALDGREASIKALDDAEKEIGGGIESESQKRLWRKISTARRAHVLDAIESHALVQGKTYKLESAEARMGSLAQDVAAFRDNDIRVKSALGALAGEVSSFAELAGMDKDQAAGKLREKMTAAVSAAVKNYIADEQPAAARAFFERYGGGIDEASKDDLLRQMRTAGVKSESLKLQFALEAANRSPDAALKALRGMAEAGQVSAEIHDATKARLEHSRAEAEHRRNKAEQNSLGMAYQWIAKNPGRDVQDMPAALLDANTKHLPSLYAFRRTGAKPENDWGEIYRLSQMPSKEFVGVNLMDYRNKMSDGVLSSMIARQVGIERGDEKAMREDQLRRAMIDSLKQIEGDLSKAGILVNPSASDAKNNPAKVQESNAFMGQMLRLAMDEAEQTKAPVAPQRMRQIAGQLLAKVETDPDARLFKGVMPRWQANRMEYGALPASQREAIDASWNGLAESEKTRLAAAWRRANPYGGEPTADILKREMWQRQIMNRVAK